MQGTDFHNMISLLTGWVYYCVSNTIQYYSTAIDTTALVMHDSNTFFYVVISLLFKYCSSKPIVTGRWGGG